ncbi:malonate decarboxylase holo-ACP synthase [Acerihabitans sp.]|uniref:malonate decarboxylase holo-ACP synthase n=1 Tax=Acerihabitans sp. TaxID=2811394 RepID=UPI002EDB5331
MISIRAHDLLWIDHPGHLRWQQPAPSWVVAHWCAGLPLVARRDVGRPDLLPVGIRGGERAQRAAAWVAPSAVIYRVSPEALVAGLIAGDQRAEWQQTPGRPVADLSPEARELPVMRALLTLAATRWPWRWGVTGSCGYMLATGLTVSTADSDLDLLIRCPDPRAREDFAPLLAVIAALPCRVDIQLDTPMGGMALLEWLRGASVMIKTDRGPVMTRDPWDVSTDQRTL